MWKVKNFLIDATLITLASCATTTHTQNTRINELRKLYPYSIIGDEFGLLTEEDLAINSCVAIPEPFSMHELRAYPYWQCFTVKDSAFECDEETDDSAEEYHVAISAIILKKDGNTHEYLSRRAIPLEECKAHKLEWNRLTKGQKYVCLSGAFINPSPNETNQVNRSWIFESYKTARGCNSYFEGGCSLKAKIEQGCAVESRSFKGS